jgi:hypothetical protein
MKRQYNINQKQTIYNTQQINLKNARTIYK